MEDELTPRQQEILEFISAFLRNYKRPPSVREIGAGVGLSSTCTVYRHLETLERRGHLERDRGESRSKARSIRLLNADYAAPAVVEVPLVGHIAAGEPILAQENIEEQLPVPASLLGSGEHFALRVRGDSMIEDGIFDGDLVVLRRQETAEENDIVAAFTPHDSEGTATLKRFHRERGRIRLQPANSAMEPIFVGPRDELQVLGRAVLAIRPL